MARAVQLRVDTIAHWNDPDSTPLLPRQRGYEAETGKSKIGPGRWEDLDYSGEPGPSAYDVAVSNGFEGDEEACKVDCDHDDVDSSLRWVFMLCLLRG